MTLKPYNAEQLDQLALRILDISYQIRQMSVAKSNSPELELAVHEKKALEWIAHLEAWAADARARLEMATVRYRGAKLASRISE
ncbi:MAG TPA: hypothetical protein VHX65_15915 [Pirellulales bacterium]|nr:hypothetical protein [Pirellulales bacterium]